MVNRSTYFSDSISVFSSRLISIWSCRGREKNKDKLLPRKKVSQEAFKLLPFTEPFVADFLIANSLVPMDYSCLRSLLLAISLLYFFLVRRLFYSVYLLVVASTSVYTDFMTTAAYKAIRSKLFTLTLPRERTNPMVRVFGFIDAVATFTSGVSVSFC